MKRYFVTLLKIVFGFFLLSLLISVVGPGEFMDAMRSVVVPLFLISFLIEPLVQVFGALGYKVLLTPLKYHLRFIYLVRAVSVSYAVGFLSPGRISEFSLAIPFREKGIPLGQALALIILDKITVFVFLSIMGSVGVLYFMGVVGFLVTILILFIIFLLIYKAFSSDKLELFFHDRILKKRFEGLKGISGTIRLFFSDFKVYLFLALLFKIFKWGFSFSAVYIIFLSMGYNLNFFALSLIFSLVVLMSTIPITFSGIGIKEGAGAILYSTFLGVSPAIASNAMLLSTAKNFFMGLIYYVLSSSLLIKSEYKIIGKKKRSRTKKIEKIKDKIFHKHKF